MKGVGRGDWGEASGNKILMQVHTAAHQMRMVESADALANNAAGSKLVRFACNHKVALILPKF